MKNRLYPAICLAFILGFFSFSCSSGGTSRVTIHIDLGLNSGQSACNNSLFDKFMRFFAKEAAAAAPTNITSLDLNITGAGMDSIHRNYTSTIPSSISVDVPAGEARHFEVLAYTPSVTLRGKATLKLSGEASVDLPITMGLYETKIIVADYNNYRIVQIDDMEGTNWTTKSSFSGFTGNFRPYDIDFDKQGRIYIGNNGIATGDNSVIRINDITATSCELLGTQGTSTTSKQVIAVDRVNNYLYYVDSSSETFYRYNINTESEDTSFSFTLPSNYISNIAVGEDGYIYATCYPALYSAAYNYVIKYNVNTHTTEKYINTNSADADHYANWLNEPWDIIYKNGYVYIADVGNAQVVQLDLDLVYQQTLSTSPDETDSFFGPHRFAAILNKKIYVTDDDEYSEARIVAFDDITGKNWYSYGQGGYVSDGEGYFHFWGTC